MAAQGKQGRVYGGLSSADREAQRRQSLLDAAIDLLVAGEKLTVRGVCARTGLTSRYFYENFRSTDELADTGLLEKADVVLYSGLHLEGKFQSTLEAMTKRGRNVVAVTDGIEPSKLLSPHLFR